ncbi:hypothetical protein Pmar_PMAR025267 [Perkinsus marinus ATCC 50983]|uniref:Uncharacterized protein n=1 Tax=Perkinsus marinus (strain ATCC 50983 / TXsc) TaxID=423536 RepID=C5L3D7_PERM5|nr:hypothetical protein Pmar_PMAR025267 [Perkinsus marinus ATCC 50983]EER08756.1 hypothetical protein Pmar_PMAR025267 [Perkinsus marinus ATCC 50983]|eukprot:XP_002776940.1 hypothetical protein Pmar_PMAR025267 [Perkinsus marinus ATCC 50983]
MAKVVEQHHHHQRWRRRLWWYWWLITLLSRDLVLNSCNAPQGLQSDQRRMGLRSRDDERRLERGGHSIIISFCMGSDGNAIETCSRCRLLILRTVINIRAAASSSSSIRRAITLYSITSYNLQPGVWNLRFKVMNPEADDEVVVLSTQRLVCYFLTTGSLNRTMRRLHECC